MTGKCLLSNVYDGISESRICTDFESQKQSQLGHNQKNSERCQRCCVRVFLHLVYDLFWSSEKYVKFQFFICVVVCELCGGNVVAH